MQDGGADLQPGAVARGIQLALSARLSAGWQDVVSGLFAELLSKPIGELVDRSQVELSLASALSAESVRGSILPLTRRVTAQVLARLHEREEPAAELVSPRAQELIEDLAAHPELVPQQLIREVMQDPAVESVLNDVLVEALRQFAERTNPFTAEWGLAGLLKRLPSFGTAPLRSAIRSMRADFEKRLDPEIRKFTAGFSKRAVLRLTELSLRKQQEPEFVALRQQVVAAVLQRDLKELCWAADDPRGQLLLEAIAEVTDHLLLHPLLQAELGKIVAEWLDEHAPQTLGEVLNELGVTVVDPSASVAVYLPVIQTMVTSQIFHAELEAALATALAEER